MSKRHIFYFGHACPKSEMRNFVFISHQTGQFETQKFKNLCSSCLRTCLHHMVILRSKNKNTDFFVILAQVLYYILTYFIILA